METGTALMETDFNGDHVDIYEVRKAHQVDLRHRKDGDTSDSGIYRCDIETNTVKNEDGRETVYVGLYAETYTMHCILYISIYYAHSIFPMAKNVWGVGGGSIGQNWWVNEYSQ